MRSAIIGMILMVLCSAMPPLAGAEPQSDESVDVVTGMKIVDSSQMDIPADSMMDEE